MPGGLLPTNPRFAVSPRRPVVPSAYFLVPSGLLLYALCPMLYASLGRTAARTTYHPYFLKDSKKLQLAHNPHLRISTPAFCAEAQVAKSVN